MFPSSVRPTLCLPPGLWQENTMDYRRILQALHMNLEKIRFIIQRSNAWRNEDIKPVSPASHPQYDAMQYAAAIWPSLVVRLIRCIHKIPLVEFPHMYNAIGIGILWFNIESITATGMPPQMSVQGGVRGGSMGIQHWFYPYLLMSRSGESNSTDEAIRTAKRTLARWGIFGPMRLGPSRCSQEL